MNRSGRMTIALLLLSTITRSAQGQYALDRWNTDAGLPQNAVNAILQSRDGHLWIATSGGIARFDGTAFVSSTTGDRSGLRSDRGYALAEDTRGRVWVATDGGLSSVHRGRIATFGTAQGLPDPAVRAVAADRDGCERGRSWAQETHPAQDHPIGRTSFRFTRARS